MLFIFMYFNFVFVIITVYCAIITFHLKTSKKRAGTRGRSSNTNVQDSENVLDISKVADWHESKKKTKTDPKY